mgnify:CR=1 FL=1
MASPYYRCPKCHIVSRKNDNVFEMVEVSGSNTVFAVAGGAPCPECGASNSFDDVYLHPKYDIRIEEVYGGKVDINLRLVSQAHQVGRIRLSEEEQSLLRQALRSSGSASSATQKSSGCFSLLVIALTLAGGLVGVLA